MEKTIDVRTFSGITVKETIVLPDQCPMCHAYIVPEPVGAFMESSERMSVLLYCNACKLCFVSRYMKTEVHDWFLVGSEPKTSDPVCFSRNIQKLSDRFCRVYNQSKAAEDMNLDEVCGAGYRKALEILVKDFCIREHADDQQNIIKEYLGTCIDRYIENTRLKSLAKAASWLGNDEVHYQRIHPKDIDSLKAYISAMLSYIDFELSADDAEQFANNKKADQ